MYCKHCLAANPAEATQCVQCGASLADAVGAVGAVSAASAAPVSSSGDGLNLQEHPAPAGAAGGPVAPSGGPIGGPPPRADETAKPEVELPPMPPDNKMWAIGTIVGSVVTAPCTCCMCFGMPSFFALILGLLALLESGKIKTFYEDKAYDAALESSNRTKKYAIIGIAVFFGIMLLGVISRIAISGLSFLTNYQSYFNRQP